MLYPTTVEYTFFSSTHETFCRIDHMQGDRTSHSTFIRTEIIQRTFFDHSRIKLEIKSRRKSGTSP